MRRPPTYSRIWRSVVTLVGVGLLLGSGGAWTRMARGQDRVPVIHVLHAEGPAVTSLVFSGDGRVLASGTTAQLRLWDTRAARLLRTIEEPGVSWDGLAISRDGRVVASVTSALTSAVRLWDTETGRLIRTLTPSQGSHVCCELAMSRDGNFVASTALRSGDEAVLVWNARNGALLYRLEGGMPFSSFYGIGFSPDGKMLAVPNDRILNLWDVRTGKLIRQFPGDYWESLAWSPEGTTLAAIVSERAGTWIELWDVRTGREIPSPLSRLADLDGYPQFVAYSPSGRFLGIIWREFNGPHSVIRLWDLRRQTTAYTLRGHDYRALAFSPDGTSLAASAGSDIVLWDGRSVLK